MKKKPKRWDVLASHLPDDRDIVGVELGVWVGEMSRNLLERFPRLTLYMVDRWIEYKPDERKTSTGKMPFYNQGLFDIAYGKALRLCDVFPGRVVIVRASTEEALDIVPFNLDFGFVDANHSRDACKNDLINWQSHIKPGGIFAGHDYKRSSHPGVTEAVDEVFPGGVISGYDGVWMVKL